MIHIKDFDLYGVKYRTEELSAMVAIDFMDETPSIALLRMTSVFHKDKWIPLDNEEVINKRVKDKTDNLSPLAVLASLLLLVYEFNYQFLTEWKPVRMPRGMMSDLLTIQVNHTNNMFARIISDQYATLRELETFYSLKDAFRLFDIIVANNVNEFLALEAAK